MGKERCLALADSHSAQSLGAEWTREPKSVPGQGSSNTGLVQICVAVRGELCYRFVRGLRVVCRVISLDLIGN